MNNSSMSEPSISHGKREQEVTISRMLLPGFMEPADLLCMYMSTLSAITSPEIRIGARDTADGMNMLGRW
jgi:hypothetical protein